LKLDFTKGMIILICSLILIRCGDNSPSKDLNLEPTELEKKNIAVKEKVERHKKRVSKLKKRMALKVKLNAERRDDINRARKQKIIANKMKREKSHKARMMQMQKSQKARDRRRQEKLKERLMKRDELLKKQKNR